MGMDRTAARALIAEAKTRVGNARDVLETRNIARDMFNQMAPQIIEVFADLTAELVKISEGALDELDGTATDKLFEMGTEELGEAAVEAAKES